MLEAPAHSRIRAGEFGRHEPRNRSSSSAFIELSRTIALQSMHYNDCRIHQALRVTPAMQAGLTDHLWEIDELVEFLD